MSALPKITVVTPSFNQGAYIERTIDSVLSQGYPNLEYIIIDGGSTDNSVEVIRKFDQHLTYWVSEKDRGQSHAINKGMLRAKGSILTWLNSDDWYVDRTLANFAELFIANPDAGVVVGRGQIVDQCGSVVYDKPPADCINFDTMCHWLDGGDFMQPSSAFTRRAWSQCGPLSEDIHIALDVDLWLKIAKAGFNFVSTGELLSTALSHPMAKTTAFVEETKLDCSRVISLHGSQIGYETYIEELVRKQKMLKLKVNWYEKNYKIVTRHPLLRTLHPLVKRLSGEGKYWQADIPPWKD